MTTLFERALITLGECFAGSSAAVKDSFCHVVFELRGLDGKAILDLLKPRPANEDALNIDYLACQMYNAYGEECDFKTWDGKPMPTWDDLVTSGSNVVDRWKASATRAYRIVKEHLTNG
jgi:hypothetical protein